MWSEILRNEIPTSCDIQGQVGCGLEKPDLVEAIPAHGMEVETHDL